MWTKNKQNDEEMHAPLLDNRENGYGAVDDHDRTAAIAKKPRVRIVAPPKAPKTAVAEGAGAGAVVDIGSRGLLYLVYCRFVNDLTLRYLYVYAPAYCARLGLTLDQFSVVIAAATLGSLPALAAAPLAATRGGAYLLRASQVCTFVGALALYVLLQEYPAPSKALRAHPAATVAAIAGMRFGFGAGYAALKSTAVPVLVTDAFPEHRRGRAFALVELAWALSSLGGLPLMGAFLALGAKPGRGWCSPEFAVVALLAVSLAWSTCALPSSRAGGDAVPAAGQAGVAVVVHDGAAIGGAVPGAPAPGSAAAGGRGGLGGGRRAPMLLRIQVLSRRAARPVGRGLERLLFGGAPETPFARARLRRLQALTEAASPWPYAGRRRLKRRATAVRTAGAAALRARRSVEKPWKTMRASSSSSMHSTVVEEKEAEAILFWKDEAAAAAAAAPVSPLAGDDAPLAEGGDPYPNAIYSAPDAPPRADVDGASARSAASAAGSDASSAASATGAAGGGGGGWGAYRRVCRRPVALLYIAVMFLFGTGYMCFQTVWSTWLVAQYGLSEHALLLVTLLGMGGAELFANLVVTCAIDALGVRRSVVLAPAATALASVVVTLAGGHNLKSDVALLFVWAACWEFAVIAYITFCTMLVPDKDLRGTAITLFNVVRTLGCSFGSVSGSYAWTSSGGAAGHGLRGFTAWSGGTCALACVLSAVIVARFAPADDEEEEEEARHHG